MQDKVSPNEIGDRRAELGNRISEIKRLELEKRSAAYRNMERRRREIARLRGRIRTIAKCKHVAGGDEYQFFEGDNYEGQSVALSIIFDNILDRSAISISIPFDKVVYYLESTESGNAELRQIIADGIAVGIKNVTAELNLVRARYNAMLKVRHDMESAITRIMSLDST